VHVVLVEERPRVVDGHQHHHQPAKPIDGLNATGSHGSPYQNDVLRKTRVGKMNE
jgi:hypothetical protein